MKRISCLVVLIAVFLCSCSVQKQETLPTAERGEYISGVWISFSELDTLLNSPDFKAEFDKVADNLKQSGITDAYVHIRAYGDAVYPSKLFPLRKSADKGYDVLEYMIKSCHKRNIRFHAWINPYRIKTSDSDISTLPCSGKVYNWLTDTDTENDKNICVLNGVYLNPASSEVRKLIIDGVREVLTNYEVDGIHFDDYFYPTTDASFDSTLYNEYLSENKTPLSLDDWRRANVNSLISGCYTAVKFIDKDIEFSISPAASIERNFDEYYADVVAWAENGCVDRIIPQLYFGFEYPDKSYCFDNLLREWESALKGYDIKLTIGLAAYKVGTKNEPDREEWSKDTDILKKQVELLKKDKQISGHIFFSYSYLFSEDKLNKAARKGLF